LLRLHYLNQPMRYDESFTYLFYASKPLRFALSSYTTPNNHLLNTLLVHLSVRALGNHPWVIRLPVLVAGVATIPMTYAAARKLFDRNAGVLAAAFVASSSWLVEFSTNARGYAFVILAFVTLVALGFDLMEAPSWRPGVLFSVVTAIGFYAAPVMLWPFATVVAWMLVQLTLRKRLRDAAALAIWPVAGLVLAFLAYLPVILTTGLPAMMRTARDLGAQGPIDELFGALWSFVQRDTTNVAGLLLAVAAMVGVLKEVRTRLSVPIFLVGIALAGMTLVAIPTHPPPRVWLFLLPLYFATASHGLFSLASARLKSSQRYFALAGVAACLALSALILANGGVTRSVETGAVPDVPRIVSFLRTFMRTGDRVQAFAYATPIVAYYLDLRHMQASPAGDRYARSILIVPTQPAPGRRPSQELSRARLVRRYASATIYILDRKS
jgi:uncharacterized membrane protein